MNKTQKDIRHCPLYPRYYADAEGHVYLDGSGEQEVRVCISKDGHLQTTTHKARPVHRITFYAFNPDAPVEGYDVHHLNEDKTDNRLENLQLLTHSEHIRLHNTGEKNPCYGRTGEKNAKSKPVLQYTKEGVFVAEYPCASEAERVTGVNHRNISMCCNRKRPTAGGYIWCFKDEPLLPEQISLYNGVTHPKPVFQYTREGVFIAKYASAREAERQTGVCFSSISACCHHSPCYSVAGGYIWRFADDALPLI